jgi:cytochrome c-type biogenesis protein CcmH
MLLALALVALPAFAVEPSEMLADPRMEARAQKISQELRCVVCQNESIDASNAPLAQDMRKLVRERLMAGDSDAEVKAYLVARYGNFVLLRPPVQTNTLLLWGGPFLVLALGAWWIVARARSRAETVAPLTEEERRALGQRLGEPRP